MGWIWRGADGLAAGLCLLGAIGAGAGILLVAGIILLEITLRTVFATSTFMSDELVGYLVAALGFLPLGYTFRAGGLLRVGLLLDRLVRFPAMRTAVEILCVVATLAVTGLLIRYFYINVERQFLRGYTSGTMSGIPQWIPTGTMLTGLVIFWVQLLVHGLGLLLGHTRPGATEAIGAD